MLFIESYAVLGDRCRAANASHVPVAPYPRTDGAQLRCHPWDFFSGQVQDQSLVWGCKLVQLLPIAAYDFGSGSEGRGHIPELLQPD